MLEMSIENAVGVVVGAAAALPLTAAVTMVLKALVRLKKAADDSKINKKNCKEAIVTIESIRLAVQRCKDYKLIYEEREFVVDIVEERDSKDETSKFTVIQDKRVAEDNYVFADDWSEAEKSYPDDVKNEGAKAANKVYEKYSSEVLQDDGKYKKVGPSKIFWTDYWNVSKWHGEDGGSLKRYWRRHMTCIVEDVGKIPVFQEMQKKIQHLESLLEEKKSCFTMCNPMRLCGPKLKFKKEWDDGMNSLNTSVSQIKLKLTVQQGINYKSQMLSLDELKDMTRDQYEALKKDLLKKMDKVIEVVKKVDDKITKVSDDVMKVSDDVQNIKDILGDSKDREDYYIEEKQQGGGHQNKGIKTTEIKIQVKDKEKSKDPKDSTNGKESHAIDLTFWKTKHIAVKKAPHTQLQGKYKPDLTEKHNGKIFFFKSSHPQRYLRYAFSGSTSFWTFTTKSKLNESHGKGLLRGIGNADDAMNLPHLSWKYHNEGWEDCEPGDVELEIIDEEVQGRIATIEFWRTRHVQVSDANKQFLNGRYFSSNELHNGKMLFCKSNSNGEPERYLRYTMKSDQKWYWTFTSAEKLYESSPVGSLRGTTLNNKEPTAHELPSLTWEVNEEGDGDWDKYIINVVIVDDGAMRQRQSDAQIAQSEKTIIDNWKGKVFKVTNFEHNEVNGIYHTSSRLHNGKMLFRKIAENGEDILHLRYTGDVWVFIDPDKEDTVNVTFKTSQSTEGDPSSLNHN
eukprot:g674.t1